METKRLQNSFSRVKMLTAITLFVLFASAMTNLLNAQAFTHVWKGGTADWGTTNWYAPHTTQGITVASGSTSVTLGAANATIAVGDYVAGYGIAPGTTVQTYPGSGTALTLSQAATAAITTTTVAFYKSSSDKGAAPTSTSLVLINSGTCTIQSTTAAVGRVFMGNSSATDQGNLVIATGGSLTTSAAANNNNTNASLVFFGGKITMSGGTLNANATGYTTNSYPIRFEKPVIAPTVSWGLFGAGTLNINHQATGGTTGGAVIFNNNNTPLNAPEIDLNNATYTNAATAPTSFYGFTVSAGANGIIGGTGFTIGTSGTPTVNNSGLILLNQGSLTVNSGTTLNFYCTSSTKNCISVQPASGTTTFTNNGSISIGGTLAKGVYLNYGAANIGTINFTNAGTITVNAAVTGIYSGALFMGGTASNAASININNSGTMSVTNTQTAGTGLGYALYCANSTSVTTNTLTNSGTLNLDGTLTSTGGVAGKTTINNTGTINLNTTGLDITVFNNNSGGVLDCKTNTLASNNNYVVTLKSGSTLKTANTGGLACISGTLPNGAVLESGANYVFNSTSAQTSGSTGTAGAALTANNIEISNSAGVTLSNATTVNGTITLTSGTLTTTPGLTLGNSASIIRAAGSLSAAPTFGSAINLTYNGTSTKGTEFPAANIINSLTANNAAGIAITDNRTISNLIISSGSSITVNAGKQLTVSTSMNNSGTLNLLSDNTGTNGTATITTPATITENAATYNIQQYITSAATGVTGRNWYISSPLSAATSATITSATGNGLVYYDGTTNWPAAGTTMDVMKGYIAVSPAQNTTISFTGGTLNTGDKSVSNLPLGFNLVGNPYPSSVDFAQASKTNVANSIWYRSKKTGSYNFHTYNVTGGVSVNDGTAIIAPMQAFWIKTTSATNSLGFTNTMRSHQDQTVDANRLMAPKANTQQLLRLQISNSVNKDETVIYFNAAAQNSTDDYDSQKMFNNTAEVPEIFTKNEGTSLAINGMNTIPYDTEIPLGFKTTAEGNFSISAPEFKNFELGTKVILKDNQNPTVETDLSTGDVYYFNAPITASVSDRFSLVFRVPSSTTGIENTAKTNVKVFVNAANQISIITPEKSIYSIYNAVGQLIENGILNTERETRDAKHLAAGVYVVKVNNQSTRIIVK